VINGIRAPDAKFGWGNRYEFGYFKGGVGVLQGAQTGIRLRFRGNHDSNTLPLIETPLTTDGITNFQPERLQQYWIAPRRQRRRQ
jgi:hypothetical protein